MGPHAGTLRLDNPGRDIFAIAPSPRALVGETLLYEAMRHLVSTATLVMLLGGCASYAWVKPDATAEMTARDDAACRAEARDLATTGYVYGGIGPPWGYPPPGRPVPYPDPSWQAVTEQRVYDRCMRDRGYELMRTDKKG
jgi:hypothetical protein